KRKNPELVDDLRVHKPYIDAVTYDSPFAKGARMERVTEVIDCWYDSGAMPFAQWGYKGEPTNSSGTLPLEGRAGEGVAAGTSAKSNQGSSPLPQPLPSGGRGAEEAARNFHNQFPADFISEAIDQTRGWFYSQLAISTMLFGERSEAGGQRSDKDLAASPLTSGLQPPHPFRNCIVLGLMLGEDGQKMSKSKRNYREPNEIFDKYGADALRWYFFANQPPWTSIRYSEQAIKDSIPEFLLRLWNVYNFLVGYATSDDNWNPAAEIKGKADQLNAAQLSSAATYTDPGDRNELDRWILSELA